MKYLIPLLLFSGCGGAYTMQVSGHVDVVASLDPSSIVAAFVSLCTSQLGTTATSDQINACAKQDLANLINGLSNEMNK